MFGKKKNIPEEKRQKLLLRIRPILANSLEIDQEKIVPSARLMEDLGVDSLDSIVLIMAFEKEFGIEILDDDAEKIRTVDDIIVYLVGRIQL